MKKLLPIIAIFLLSCQSYSQKDVFLLINENDTLISKQISKDTNSYTGYRIYYDKKVRVKKNNTPLLKPTTTEKIKVWVEDSKYDYYVLQNP